MFGCTENMNINVWIEHVAWTFPGFIHEPPTPCRSFQTVRNCIQVIETAFTEWIVLALSQAGVCTDLFENFSMNSLKRDPSIDTTFNSALFSLGNTFQLGLWCWILMQRICIYYSQLGNAWLKFLYDKKQMMLIPLARKRSISLHSYL